MRNLVRSTSSFPLHSPAALQVTFWWDRGVLVGERIGMCICPNDVIAHSISITVCPECLMMPGQALRGITTHRRLPLLGVHFQDWKKQWSRSERALLMAHNGERPRGTSDPVPTCPADTTAFQLNASGFLCTR